ncbi:MAG: CDP-alcohol phosphatidyltransferase family protein [Clostridia bacterium]|nr:CDP-alcohol phosphatidyltransferase family protein [Clostridia bacterium]
MKRLQFTKKEICTIPNLLTLIRFLCIPAVIALVIVGGFGINGNPQWLVYVGLGLMVFAAATDIVDGWIARRFNQNSYIGQLVDPIADKAMHVGTILSLCIIGYVHWAFLALLALRELMMIVVGSFIVNKVNIKANMLGKVASFTISVGVIASFFHNHISTLWGDYGIDWIIITIGLVLNWAAAINYAVESFKQVKADKLAEANKNEDAPAEETVAEEVSEVAVEDATDVE